MARELEAEIPLDVGSVEVLERTLDERARGVELPRDLQERVTRDRHVGWAVCHEDQQAHAVEAAGEIIQHVDRRGVGPVQILQEQHEWADPRHVQEVGGKLALHPLLRRALDVFPDLARP